MFLKKLTIELPYYPAIPLLGMYPEKSIIRKDACTPVFIAALFTIARTWKQPICPINRVMDKEDVVHIYNGILLSQKRNKIVPFAETWMDLEIVIQSEVSQKEKNKYLIILLICGI